VPNHELAVYFSAADVVVLPYLEATQSGVAQIALGFEKLMVGTAVGGMADVIQEGRTGYIVPPGDAGSLAVAIVKLLRNDQAETFVRNIRIQKETASWMPLVSLIEELAEPVVRPQTEQPEQGTPSPRVL
jgi:glycosyltransferase involved in cell wall biosynthesis